MKRLHLDKILGVITALCASACADDPVLGERPCQGVLSGCDGDERITLAYQRVPDLVATPRSFEVTPTRTVTPSWALPLEPCEYGDDLVTFDTCTGTDSFVPGLDGAFWLVHVDGASPDRPFARLIDRDGVIVREVPSDELSVASGSDEVTSDGEGGLLVTSMVDSPEQPDPSFTRRFVRATRVASDGTTTVHDLRELATTAFGQTLTSVVRTSDGGFRARQVGDAAFLEPLVVAAVGADGRSEWRESYAASITRLERTGTERAPLFRRARALPDGALALLADFATTSGLYPASPARGLVVLEADGTLRSAAAAAFASPSRGELALHFASNAKGDLVTLECDDPTLGASLLSGDLVLEFHALDGTHHATMQGMRTGYYAASPGDIALDDAGTAYVLVYVGERGAPAPLVCAVPREGQPECVALALCDAGQQAIAFQDPAVTPAQAYGLLAPEPGVVIAALAYACVDAAAYRAADGRAQAEQLADGARHDVVRVTF